MTEDRAAGPAVSVVVPTRNRSHLLPGLLAALDGQEHPEFEVIVVDDGSSDGTWEILTGWQGDGRRALRLEAPSGSYAARNLGWRAARGTIVAFTDDDCLPAPQWLSRLIEPLQTRSAVAVQGVTRAEPGEITPFTHQIDQRRPGPPYRTCNMAYRRSILEDLGGFDARLRWYADNLLGLRARQIGKIAFAPGAIVLHPPRPREWRDRSQWQARFDADAIHRRELRRLGVEPAVLPARALPLVLWLLRPIARQSLAHLRYLARNPGEYVRQAPPMLREKMEILAALREYWREPSLPSPTEASGKSPGSPPDAPMDVEGTATLSRTPEWEPLVSVVVVTRDRPELLDGALAALERQTYSNREVVVVDNGAPGETRAVAERHGARYVTAPGVALGAARQAGIGAARGEIVAFTDDDCLPHPGWLQALVEAFRRQPELCGVQGRTLPEPGPVGSHAVGVLGPDPLYQTCNIAYRRTALEQAGGCDPGFQGWFEDTALGARVREHGPIGFQAEAVVTHRAMPRRPLDRERWVVLLQDERRLAERYPTFYRGTRGRNALSTVLLRWLLGSPVKTLVRELPRSVRDLRGFLHLLQLLLWERRELVYALLAGGWGERRFKGDGAQRPGGAATSSAAPHPEGTRYPQTPSDPR